METMAPRRVRGSRLACDSPDRHEPQTPLVVLGVEVQPIGRLTLGDDHGHRALEFLARNRGGGDLVDSVLLDVLRPARTRALDPRPGVAGTLQQIQKLVVVEIDYLGSSHGAALP